MRLLLVSQEYPPETGHGGIGTQTHLKAHGLAARGHQVKVLSASPGGEPRRLQDGAVEVWRVPAIDRHLDLATEPARWVWWSVEVAAAIAALRREWAADLIEFPEWGGEGFVHLLNRAPWNRAPVVVQLHGPLVMLAHTVGWPERDSDFYRTGIHLEGTCLRLADAVYSSSACSADWCAGHYGLDRRRIPVLHSGVDTERFRPRPEAKGVRPTVLFVGHIARNKGVEPLLEACLEIAPRFPGLRLRLVGRGETWLLERLARRAREAGAGDLLELPGFVAHAALPEELAGAHVFALPSLYEGGPGFAHLEAMSCALPVVACQGSGIDEVIAAGETGVLVPPGDAVALGQALERLLGDEEERKALGARARAHVLAHAATERCMERLEEFYAGVVRSCAAAGSSGEGSDDGAAGSRR